MENPDSSKGKQRYARVETSGTGQQLSEPESKRRPQSSHPIYSYSYSNSNSIQCLLLLLMLMLLASSSLYSFQTPNFVKRIRMSSTTAFPSSLFISSEAPSFLLRRGSGLSFFTSPTSFVCYPRSSNSRILRVSASPLHPDVDISWFPPDPNSPPDNYGGWAVVQAPPTHKTKKKGFSSIFVGSVIGSSLATAIAIAYFLFYGKGFKFEFRSPLNTFHEVFSSREAKNDQTDARDYLESDEQAAEAIHYYVPVAVTEIVPSGPFQMNCIWLYQVIKACRSLKLM